MDKTVGLWRTNSLTGRQLRFLKGHASRVTSVAFKSNSTILASGSLDKTIRLWDAATGAHLMTLEGHTAGVTGITFSSDGTLLASASEDETVRLWDATTGSPLKTLVGHTDGVTSVAFMHDSYVLASGGQDETIILWDAATGEFLKTLAGHQKDVRSVAFGSRGAILASGSLDETVRLWHTATGTLLTTLTAHTEPVRSVAFARDGTTLASASRDDTLILWKPNFSTRIGITPSLISSPPVGERLTLNVSIADGANVGGYQLTVQFDSSALRYVESANGDYFSADAFLAQPIVNGERVILRAGAPANTASGAGTLATLTFEVVAEKTSAIVISEAILTGTEGNPLPFFLEDGKVTEPQSVPEDVNNDRVVNILDLVKVASRFNQMWDGKEDVNGDGIVNIVDLVKVANALAP